MMSIDGSKSARRVLAPLILAAAAGQPGSVSASPNDWVVERVHASACELEDPADRDKVSHVEGDLIFASGQVGTVVLHCPIFTPYQDEDYGVRTLGFPTLWYRDDDGAGGAGSVQMGVYYRAPTATSASSYVPYALSSNNSAVTTFTTITVVGSIFPHVMQDAQYEARVVMSRTSTFRDVRFRGITFRDHP